MIALFVVGFVITAGVMFAVFGSSPPLRPALELQPGTAPTASATAACNPVRDNNFCAPAADRQLSRALAAHRATGLTCTRRPTLTDTVLFQYASDLSVDTVTFERALELGRRGQGWAQAYCA